MENYLEKSFEILNENFYHKLFQLVIQIIHQNKNKYVIALPASALKNKGINQILNSIQAYLPCPHFLFDDKETTFLFVFKTQ